MPSDEYDAVAAAIGDDVEVIAVDTLQEALDALDSLGGNVASLEPAGTPDRHLSGRATPTDRARAEHADCPPSTCRCGSRPSSRCSWCRWPGSASRSSAPTCSSSRPLARLASGIGFAALAAAALLSGSLIVDDPDRPDRRRAPLQRASCCSLGASLSWRPDDRGRQLFRIGLVALVIAELALAGDEASTLADVARSSARSAVGACLLGASSRVISARIAASGAMVLFAVITVVAVALSAVVSNNIEDEALRRYGARAETGGHRASRTRPLPS